MNRALPSIVAAALSVAVPVLADVTIRGRVVDTRDLPLAGVPVQATADPAAGAASAAYSESDGSFSVRVPAGAYVLGTGIVPAPYLRSFMRVDARGGDVNDVVLRVGAHTPFVPDDPPRAALIDVSVPDANGNVTVTGAGGAVAPGSFLMLVTIDTGVAVKTRAGDDGSFQVSIAAAFGSTILVKADPHGEVFNRLGDQVNTPSLSLMAGTIVRVREPPAGESGVVFSRSGTINSARPEDPAGHPLIWTFEGTMGSQSFQPGETLRITGTLRIVSSALEKAGPMQLDEGSSLNLDLVAGPDGSGALAQNTFSSTLMTPTALPIERERNRPVLGLLSDFTNQRIDLVKTASDRAEAQIELSIDIPADVVHGFYVPIFRPYFHGVPLESPPSRFMIVTDKLRSYDVTYLPIVRIGNPAPPRVPALLLGDRLSNGTLGGRAREDHSSFALSSRIRMNDRIIVRRADALGSPIRYRLEPFLPTIGLTDAGSPNMPLVRFRFPSGHLTVRIEAPDGSSRTLGPAPFVQPALRSNGLAGTEFRDHSGDHFGPTTEVTEIYGLTTLDPRYQVEFASDGPHVVTLQGQIEDLAGNTWSFAGTYDVLVARTLSVESAVIPGTPFIVGDRLSTNIRVSPPVPAEIEFRIQIVPESDPSRRTEEVIRGRADRFGYFGHATSSVPLREPGEYRVDVTASFTDRDGAVLAGGRTWGSVIAPAGSPIIAHGRRGEINGTDLGTAWFVRSQNPVPQFGHPCPPFHSGDVFWGSKSDNAFAVFTIQDPEERVTSLLRARRQGAGMLGPGTFDERAAIGELPLFSSRSDSVEPHIDPSRVDLWGYSYRFVERPALAVREYIAEDGVGHGYWRFNDEVYAGQIGAGIGDLPNDFKFFFGGAALHGSALSHPLYAAYGSLLVIVPEDDPHGGMRVFPPFRGNGGGPDGGPLFELKGEEIDLFFHPTGLRPGTVMHAGERVAFTGYSAPSLPSRVEIQLTSPSGQTRTTEGRANKIGYFHPPDSDFVVVDPGAWRAKVTITFDGVLPSTNGQVEPPFPTGDVLGSRDGEFYFYVVRGDSEPLEVTLPGHAAGDFIRPADGPLTFQVTRPSGLTDVEMYTTTTMPGFVLEETHGSSLSYTYDAPELAKDFPNLDLHFDGGTRAGADPITISFLLSGTDSSGARRHFARQIVIQGEELQMPEQPRPPKRRRAVR